jgi:hypothetical protein
VRVTSSPFLSPRGRPGGCAEALVVLVVLVWFLGCRRICAMFVELVWPLQHLP